MWNLGFKIKDNSGPEITLLSLDGTTGKSLKMVPGMAREVLTPSY